MENITSMDQSLVSIDESNIEYIDLMKHPELFHGNVNFVNNTVDFCKYSKLIQDEMEKFGPVPKNEMDHLNSASCGARLRFYTDSEKFILKIKLSRKWDYQKMVSWNSSGFDVYNVEGDDYIPRTIFAPVEGNDFFAELVYNSRNGLNCIFLPNYNTIEQIHIGIDKNSILKPFPYPDNGKLPVLFYGNSITQGAAASKSGNSFPNLVSKMLNRDIINMSCSSCCRATKNISDEIGRINCHSIVIDYTRNANSIEEFKETYDQFYRDIRSFHPTKKIILMTSSSFNHLDKYVQYDEIVKETYLNAKDRNENTFYINQTSLFNYDEWDYIVIDPAHFTDHGMYKIANEICKILKKE